MPTFPIRRSRWGRIFLAPLALGLPTAAVDDGSVVVRMGWLGRADIPLERVAGVGTMNWPWWGGVGARIARGLVTFVGASGPAAVIDLTEPTEVRAPLKWTASRLAIGVEDVDGFVAAIVGARGEAAGEPPSP